MPRISCRGIRTSGRPQRAYISELLREGQELTVQVVKDPLGTKGARLTTQSTIPSRYLVFIPNVANVGISQKIEDEAERIRLRDVIQLFMTEQDEGGYIARTAAEGASAEALRADMIFLRKLWSSISERERGAAPKSIVYEDLPLSVRVMRDLLDANMEKVRIDSRESYQRVLHFAEMFMPDLAVEIEYYPGERPIFDLYGVEDEIQKALERKVQLKSGGYLIFDQTEAMTTIDVNTGGYVGHRNLEETIFKTNLEAARPSPDNCDCAISAASSSSISSTCRRRNTSARYYAPWRIPGTDHAKTQITEVSRLGLVEMTRKRTRESLGHILCEPVPDLPGRGSLKTPETICYEIFREILRESRQFDVEQCWSWRPRQWWNCCWTKSPPAWRTGSLYRETHQVPGRSPLHAGTV